MKNRELIQWATCELMAAGVPESDVDAWELFSYVFDMDRKTYLICSGDEIADSAGIDRYEECIRRRSQRIPLQQITGRTWFMGMEFAVNSDVLCPRQDTELLVEQALERIKPGMRVLDLCTGSGCVLISLLSLSRGTVGRGVDISEESLAVAEENGRLNGLDESRIAFFQSDLFSEVSGIYDIITCNPPYIESGEILQLMPEVRDHEPHRALDGGEDGLDYYRRVIVEAREYLADSGVLLFEIGVSQRVPVSALLESNGYVEVECYRDYAGNDRVVLGIKGESNAEESGE